MAECKHGLDDAWCASCKHPLRHAAETPEIGPPIRAGYHGTCSRCPEPIEPGDVIRNVDLTWAHADCLDA